MKRLFTLTFFIAMLGPALLLPNLSFADEPATDVSPLHVDKVAFTPEEPKPGTPVEMKIDFHVDSGYHAYINQFHLKVDQPKGLQVSQFDVEPTVEFVDPLSHKMRMGTEHRAQIVDVFNVPESAPAGDLPLQLQLTYQACGVKFCLFPKTIPVHADLVVAGEPNTFTRALAKGSLYALLVVFIAGVLTSLTPCIFPMIPITVAILGTQDHRHGRGFLISSSYVLGIATTYSILGVIAAKTGAMFGSLLGNPLVVGVIALVFVLMGLSMFGLFEIQIPHALAQRLSSSNQRKGIFPAFASGLAAGVVASPCVGPVLISVLAYVAQKQSPVMGFVYLFTFALGFGQLFLLIGTSQALWQKLPRSGPWMSKVKIVFGAIMIAMAYYYVRPVLPASWMSFGRPSVSSNVSSNSPAAPANRAAPADTSGTAAPATGPAWQNYSDKVLATAERNHKPAIIDFSAQWCLACAELDKYTYSDEKVMQLGHSFVWIRFDATSPSEALTRLRAKYGIGGLPFVIFIDGKGKWRRDLTLTGYENATAFLARMNSALN